MKALIIGKGISGKSANKLLKKVGYMSYFVDDKMNLQFDKLLDRLQSDLSLAVVCPGVSLDNNMVKSVQKRNIPLLGETELGTSYLKPDFIAITGTNGKTTTTTLVGELLKSSHSDNKSKNLLKDSNLHNKSNKLLKISDEESTTDEFLKSLHADNMTKVLNGSNIEKKVYVGGNIGVPVYSFALEAKSEDSVVLEISSFQLETISSFKPKVACILNITPDHLNRHKTMQNYINIKLRIFENQDKSDYSVINLDDEELSKIDFSYLNSNIYYFSTKKECKGCYAKDGCIYFNDGTSSKFIMKTSGVPLRGEHNLSNVLAGLTCAILYGERVEGLPAKVQKFKGVSHRLEFIKEVNSISYINDSKSTNISSTIVAMQAMSEPTTVILGGSDKGFEFDELFTNIPSTIKNFVVFGQTKDKILRASRDKKVSNVYEAESLKDAVMLATTLSSSGDTVLLSPACASFDMFSNYEQRGKVFASIVREIARRESSKVSNKRKRKV